MAHAFGVRELARAALVEELIHVDPAEEALFFILAETGELLQRMIRQRERDQPTRVAGYVEITIPQYTNQEFKAHFRMERQSFERLHQLLRPHLSTRMVSTEKKLLATLWLLGNKESFRGVADRFDLSKGFLHNIFNEVCSVLQAVQPQFISWPTRQEQEEISTRFLNKTGFPGIVGCIDGSHISILAPSDHRADYINRKGYASVQLQAVCDDNLRFLDIYTGWPGSVHDARVFRNSPLYGALEGGNLHNDHHLLGDSAYGLKTYKMVPFRDNGHLTAIQRNFNLHHSSARVAIERAFGLLKSKFRRLQHLEMNKIEAIPLVVMSACILHNFILMTEKLDVEDVDIEAQDNVPLPLEAAPQVVVNMAAANKRNDLANLLV